MGEDADVLASSGSEGRAPESVRPGEGLSIPELQGLMNALDFFIESDEDELKRQFPVLCKINIGNLRGKLVHRRVDSDQEFRERLGRGTLSPEEEALASALDLIRHFHQSTKHQPDDATGFMADDVDIIVISDPVWRQRLRVLFDYGEYDPIRRQTRD